MSEAELTHDERADYQRRIAFDRPHDEAIRDPLWRLANLYKISDDAGREIIFKPTAEQAVVIYAIHVRKWRRLIIPKARQLGMSTVICLISFDLMLFRGGVTTALVDKTDKDAAKKMRGKIHYAWERLPAEIKETLVEVRRNDSQLAVRAADADGPDAISSYDSGVSYRGDTCQFLHVSEWGWIQCNDRNRSVEIANGSLPAVIRATGGVCVVETTWDGGKEGEVWDLVREALETPEEAKGPETWRILFFAWWSHPGYSSRAGYVDETTQKYFDGLERSKGLSFTIEQMRWYANQRRTLKHSVLQEYPTIMEECWERPVVGAIYGEEMAELRASGRLCEFEWYRDLPIFASWDLGLADSTVVWLLQPAFHELLILDWYESIGEPLHVHVDQMNRWEREFRAIQNHYMPHDAARRNNVTLESYQESAAKAGLRNIITVPATQDVWIGINHARPLLRRTRIHTRCDQPVDMPDGSQRMSGVACLESYRKKVEVTASRISEMPIHDHTSHSADAFRTFVEAFSGGMVPSADQILKRSRRVRRRKARMGAR